MKSSPLRITKSFLLGVPKGSPCAFPKAVILPSWDPQKQSL